MLAKLSNIIGSFMLVVCAVVSSPSLCLGEYKKGWSVEEVNEAIYGCKLAVLKPQIDSYTLRSLRDGHTDKEISDELDKFLPILEKPAGKACYCFIDKVASRIEKERFAKLSASGDFSVIGELLSQQEMNECFEVLEKLFKTRPSGLGISQRE